MSFAITMIRDIAYYICTSKCVTHNLPMGVMGCTILYQMQGFVKKISYMCPHLCFKWHLGFTQKNVLFFINERDKPDVLPTTLTH